MRINSLVVMTLSVVFTLEQAFAEDRNEKAVAKGVVYHDVNGDGQFNSPDKPLPDIKVSNGRKIVRTDADGMYHLPVDDDTMLFVIKPRGWRTPLSQHQLPRFYYIHKPKGSPQLKYKGVAPTGPLPDSIDFPLSPQKEPKQFRAILFGDPQPRDQKEIDYIAHDVVEELIGTDASFGVTLGDIMFDDLSLFGSHNSAIALIGIPWYNVIGNHDINYDAKHDKHSDETFERVYGPSYYSFDYGTVHFLVLDDVEWYIPEKGGKGKYRGGLGEEQMEFIRHDLSMIPKDQLVVLMMHIPVTDIHNRKELYRLIEKRPFCMSISGHTHTHEHRFIKNKDGWYGPEPHHHVINVTVSGSWWSGKPDERGIPHTMMADGAPNGYSIISFDGAKYRLDFKAAGKPADYQMRIHAPETILLSELDKAEIYVNFFNGSERSKLEMRLGHQGDWVKMERIVAADPAFLAVLDRERSLKDKKFRALPKPKASTHLWRSKLPKSSHIGTHLLSVRATDMSGRVFYARRVIRLKK